MAYSAFTAKWIMRLYPPLLFNRIVVQRISADFKEVDVRIKKSWLNRNLQGSIFGGTLFSAADPFYPLMYWNIFSHRGRSLQAWVRFTEGDYKLPADSNMLLHFRISDEDIAEAEKALDGEEGRFKKFHTVAIKNTGGATCVEFRILVYMKAATKK
jgi:hypothetical protein